MECLNLSEAWHHWLNTGKLDDSFRICLHFWNPRVFWLARISKILQLFSSLVIIIEIIGSRRIRNFAQSLHNFSNSDKPHLLTPILSKGALNSLRLHLEGSQKILLSIKPTITSGLFLSAIIPIIAIYLHQNLNLIFTSICVLGVILFPLGNLRLYFLQKKKQSAFKIDCSVLLLSLLSILFLLSFLVIKFINEAFRGTFFPINFIYNCTVFTYPKNLLDLLGIVFKLFICSFLAFAPIVLLAVFGFAFLSWLEIIYDNFLRPYLQIMLELVAKILDREKIIIWINLAALILFLIGFTFDLLAS